MEIDSGFDNAKPQHFSAKSQGIKLENKRAACFSAVSFDPTHVGRKIKEKWSSSGKSATYVSFSNNVTFRIIWSATVLRDIIIK